MAKVLAAGGRLDSVTAFGTLVETTAAGTFDPAYADCALDCLNQAAAWRQTFSDETTGLPVDVVTGETLFCHFEVVLGIGGSASNNNFLWRLFNSSGQVLLVLRQVSANNIGIFGNTGTPSVPVYTQIGSTFFFPVSTRLQIDIKVTIGSPHSVEWSINGLLHASGSFTQNGITSARNHQGLGLNTGTTRFSQIMATEGRSTIGGKVRYSRATAAGANSGWSGVIGSINEAIDNTTTVNTAASAGLKQSYAMGDVTLPTGFVIAAVFHGIFGKNDGVSPLNIKSLLRSSATDYSSANLAGIGTSFGPLIQRYDVDPATSAAWTASGFNALEAGFESAA